MEEGVALPEHYRVFVKQTCIQFININFFKREPKWNKNCIMIILYLSTNCLSSTIREETPGHHEPPLCRHRASQIS